MAVLSEAVEEEGPGGPTSKHESDPALVSMLDKSKISSPQAATEPTLLSQRGQTSFKGSKDEEKDKEQTQCKEAFSSIHPLEDRELAGRLPDIMIRRYDPSLQEEDTTLIRSLISQDLSEPYGIYVYRYFLFTWPNLTWLALDRATKTLIGTVVCKLEPTRFHHQHRQRLRGYIAMIAVQKSQRKRGLGTILAERAMQSLKEAGADEIVLETEECNTAALKLYKKLGFLRTKHLKRYYLNGNSAFRLVMYVNEGGGGGDSSDDYDQEDNYRRDEYV